VSKNTALFSSQPVNLLPFSFFAVTDVPDAETHYHAHEFLDATVQPKPIYISPNEVYGMHSLLSKCQDKLASVSLTREPAAANPRS
jgi:hypothetical protein